MQQAQARSRTRTFLRNALLILAGGMVGVVATFVVAAFVIPADRMHDDTFAVVAVGLPGTAATWAFAMLALWGYGRLEERRTSSYDSALPDMTTAMVAEA
jgi:predicted transporter